MVCYQSIALTASAIQAIQVPCSFKYVRGLIFVLRRSDDIQAIGPTAINKMVEYSPDITALVRLNVKVNGVRRQLQDITSFEWLYEMKRLFPKAELCDYFLDSKIGPTTNTRTIYGVLVGRNYDESMESGKQCISIGVNISPNGATT